MFLKPFRIKSQTAIKGSDRKKLRAELARQFPLVPDSQWADVVPSKEEMSAMKIYSHAGDNVVVYCLQGNPAFFEHDKVVYPTVYTLWRWPDLLPQFTTWPPVFKKIQGGADLMLPGVVTNEELSPRMFNRIHKAAPCSVKLLGNRSPVAVGKTALSGEDMFLSAMRGKGVLVLHSYLDLLWAHGDKSNVPLVEDTQEMVTHEYDSASDEEQAAPPPVARHGCSAAPTLNGEGATGGVEALDDSDADQPQTSPQDDMDRLLEHCFLCALKSKLKHADLPLLTSTFFKTHMMPFCPPDKILDVKKSSHKKLTWFLQVMEQRQLVVVKQLSLGVDSIVQYDKDHLDLRGFRMSDITPSQGTIAGSDDSRQTFQPPQITEVFIVSSGLLPFFKLAGYKKGHALIVSQVRTAVIDYVKAENLQVRNDKSQVTLDPLLSDMVVGKGEYRETLSWEELVSRFLSKLGPGHLVQMADGDPVLHKGKLEPIQLNVVQRASNKKVTLVMNVERFGVNPVDLAHEVQTRMACSTTLSPLPGKNKSVEVLVQGNQVSFIVKLLTEKYQIPKKFILGAEKAKSTKKKK